MKTKFFSKKNVRLPRQLFVVFVLGLILLWAHTVCEKKTGNKATSTEKFEDSEESSTCLEMLEDCRSKLEKCQEDREVLREKIVDKELLHKVKEALELKVN